MNAKRLLVTGGITATLMTSALAGSAAAAPPPSSHGCSLQTCITLTGTAASYRATGQGENFYGHVHIWGPGIDYNGPTGTNPVATRTSRGSGTVCAEGWEHLPNGTLRSKGLACNDVR